MATVITSPIPNIQTPWENYSGDSVERFIKDTFNDKYGWLYRTPQKLSDGYYHIYAFASQDTYQEWRETGNSELIIQNISLPNPENASYAVELTTNSSTNKLVNLGDGVKIGLKFTSTSTDPYTLVTTDTGNDGTLYIQKYNNGYWITQATLQIASTPIASDVYTQYDITEYLSDGDNKIRVRVDDNVNGQSSANIVFNSIVNTTLALENVTSQTNPLTAMTFNYYIQGRITKTLNIKLTTSNAVVNYTFPIGESIYTETYYTTPVISGTFHTGIISVESWLSVDEYPELESDHVFNEYYFVNSEEPESEPVLIINNLIETATNYTPANFFNFILFNQSVDVTVTFYNSNRSQTYLTYTYQNCPVNTLMTFSNELQVESQAAELTSIIVITTGSTVLAQESITIDNSVNFNPTAGADFVLNPQTRSNSDNNRNTIINQQTGATISSTFTNFDFVNDGWVKDEDNISVLRVPTGRTLTINYDVLNNLSNGTTFEMDFKVRNVFNDDSVVFRFCEYSGTTLYGFEMKSLEAAFGTQQNTVRRDQDVMFSDETRTHLAINIIPNLSNSGLNYIRIFINGIINREMLYNSNDIFKLSNTLPIIIGGEDVDIDIYSIRVYKKSLSSENIRQDYISALPTREDKVVFKEANNILANSIISYDLASVKYNTLVWTGTPASYANQGEGIGNGTLTINILGRPECSGTINNMTVKGQGSSSKGYWKWNQQYGFSDDSVWIDGNGETRGKYYKITPDAQPAKKLVAKINWASSMQSHKIGATALYDDLWKRVIGGNSITNTEGYESCRIAVKEEPFLFFVKSSENANPVFYGLMTFGPGKGDKPTFGYYPEVFPYQLWIEGSDNGLPLISRQVPWIDGDVTYNEGDEFFEYANFGNIDYNLGDLTLYTKFKDAYNYTFLHSQRLKPFTGNIPSNADITYQYWNDATMNVYRYDYINLQWVNAGITKENGEYSVLNLESQTGLLRTNYSSNEEYNAAVIAWRTADFRTGISTYYDVNDCLFTMAFLKIIAASDNRCKNTYEYLDPTTRLICLWQDDMDTILATDNVGRKNKPYYVEEHDKAANGNNYWNGEDNVFYNLMESAFSVELRGMINSIFSAMRNIAGTVEQCMYNYFFYVQNYFPAVAYNETTRLLYEQAAVAQKNGQYTNGTPAITQALGDQLQTEKMWWKRREPYMESLSAANPFAARSTGALGFRANSMLDGGGNASATVAFNFDITPQQWLYPKVGAGQSLGGDNTRVEALDNYITNTINTSADTDCFIYGADYYVNYGEFVNIPVGEVFELTGAKLLSFSADSRNASVAVQFRPTAMTVNCPNLRNLTLYGISSLTGSLDLSACPKLQTLDLRGTSITSVILPESYDLTTAYLPSTLVSLTANNVPNLSNLSIVDYSTIRIINTDNSDLALTVITNASNLVNAVLNNINIVTNSNNVEDVLDFIASDHTVCTITGYIYLDKVLSESESNTLESKYGSNIFVEGSSFYIEFRTVPITAITLTASNNTLFSNDSITINASFVGNEPFNSYTWNVNSTDTLNLTKSRNSLVINSGNLTTTENITVIYTITRKDNTVITQTLTLSVTNLDFYITYNTYNNQSVRELLKDNELTVYHIKSYTTDYIEISNFNIECSNGSVTINDSNTTTQLVEDEQSVIEYTDEYSSGNYSWKLLYGDINGLGEVPYDIASDDTYSLTDKFIITVNNINIYIPFSVISPAVEITFDSNNTYEYYGRIYPLYSVQCINGAGTTHIGWTISNQYLDIVNFNEGSCSYKRSENSYATTSITNGSKTGGNITFTNVGVNQNGLICIIYFNILQPIGNINYRNMLGELETYVAINLSYEELGATIKATFKIDPSVNTALTDYSIFSTHANFSGWPTNNNVYVEQYSCSISFYSTEGNTDYLRGKYDLIWNVTNQDYEYTDSTLGTISLRESVNIPYGFIYRSGYPRAAKFVVELSVLSNSSWNNFNCGWRGNTNLTAIEFSNINTFGDFVLHSCTNLYSVKLPDTLGTITGQMFYEDTSLTSITIPNTVTEIDIYAFYGSGLTSINIPNSVTAIRNYAFDSCSNLTSLSIGSGINNIYQLVFANCSKLNTIIINKSTAPTIRDNSFGATSNTAGYSSETTNVLYVPQNATGYDTTNWTGNLLNASYGKFTLSKTL